MFKLKTAEEAIITQLSSSTIDYLEYFNNNLIDIFSKDNKEIKTSDLTEKENDLIIKELHLDNANFYIFPKINSNNELELLTRLFELNKYRVLNFKKRLVIVLI